MKFYRFIAVAVLKVVPHGRRVLHVHVHVHVHAAVGWSIQVFMLFLQIAR